MFARMFKSRLTPAVASRPGSLIAGLLCAFLAASAHAFPALQDPSTAAMEHQFQQALAAQDQGDLDRAESLLRDLHNHHPGIFQLDETLGLLLVSRGNVAGALPLLQSATQEQPSSDVAHVNLGAAYFTLQRNKQALQEYIVAARLNPNNPATQQGLGELLLDEGHPDQAANAFTAALVARPGNPDLELSLATALVAAGKFDQATTALEKFPDANSSADAQVLLGQIAEGKGLPLDAERHFHRAAELDPSEDHVWTLGTEYLRHWTFAAAIAEFEAAVQKFPDSTRMKLALGAAYFGDSRYSEAIPIFAALLDRDNNNRLYAELLGMACNAVTETAKQNCSGLLTYAHGHPLDAKVSTYAASMLLTETASDRRLAEARVLLQNAIAAAPQFAGAQYQMGLLKQEDGDWPGSIQNLEAAVKLQPDLAQAHYRLALAYWRASRKEEAEAQMALQKQYAQQEQQDLDQRLRQITTFLVDVRKQ
jgi:tetratricopeptide (TPR) repeat protein